MRFSALLLFVALIAAPASADWLANLGTPCPPGGVAAAGDTIAVLACDDLILLNADGTFRASRRIDRGSHGGLNVENLFPAKKGLLLAGVAIDESYASRPVVARLDEQGTVQWARVIKTRGMTHANFAVEATNGDVIVAARSDDAVLIARFTSTGTMKSTSLLDRTDEDSPTGLVATSDGGALFFASVRKKAAGVTRIGPDGKVQWDVVLGTTNGGGFFHDAVELPDGGFIAVGRARSYVTLDRSGWIARFSKKGAVLWQKQIGGEAEDGLYAIERAGGEVVAVGGTASAAGNADTWLVWIAADGAVQREMTFGTDAEDGPLENRYNFAASTDGGDVIFASPARPALFIGRVRSTSAECPATHAIRSNITAAAAAVQNEGTLLLIDATITIEPMSVSTLPASGKATRLCEWTASVAKPTELRVAAATADEHEAGAASVAQLLIARKFGELDALAADLRSSRQAFDLGDSKLRAFYEALGQEPQLAALGDAAHIRLLEEWSKKTRSATSAIARAFRDAEVAWRTRGTGFSNTILPRDAQEFDRQTEALTRSLEKIEATGGCDVPCFELQIQISNLGGWSEPLRKIMALDPTYWQAFVTAAVFLAPQWGGAPNEDMHFAESAATETKASLGDSVYAKILLTHPYERDTHPARLRIDWPRMRKGFADFQRLHPRSRLNAEEFASAAYGLARDREAVRTFFGMPLLAGIGTPFWRDRANYDRIRTWAFAEPVEPFAKTLATIKTGPTPAEWPRMVAPTRARFTDGSSQASLGFLAQTPDGPTGVTVSATPHYPGQTSYVIKVATTWSFADTPLATVILPSISEAVLFKPAPEITAKLYPLKINTSPVVTGDRLFVVACASAEGTCSQELIEVRAVVQGDAFTSFSLISDAPIDWPRLTGAPILDDTGALAGAVRPYSSDAVPPGGRGVALQLVLGSERRAVTLTPDERR